MKNEADIAFALLRSAINGEAPALGDTPIETETWWSVFKLMQRNHVAALASMAVEHLDIPREVKIPWLAECEKAARWFRYQLEVQQDIVDTMKQNGIDTLVLKGTHLAQYYPNPEQREFGDLDLYFYNRHVKADEIAKRKLKVTVDNKPHHHTKYNYRGMTIENHFDFFNRHYPSSNKRYNKMLVAMEPSPTFDVLHFLRHAAIHFAANGLKLRDLCDWAMLVSNGKDIKWEKVADVMKRFGMTRFVATIDDVTRTRLGIASPLQGIAPAGASQHMVNDIFSNKQHDGAVKQYFHTRWKRRLAFSDSLTSQLLHKITSHLSH